MDRETIHILLVEDSETHAILIRDALESGHTPVKLTVAQNLAEAHVCLRESFPHLAIIDLLLPDGNGVELLSAQKEKQAYPVVIMTSQGDEQTAVEAMKAGEVDYVVKSSATLAEMPRIVERALREWRHITERKHAQEALQESEERFRSFFESAASGMAIIDLKGRTLRINPTFCRLSGYSEAEALRMNIFEVTHPDDREKTRHLYDEIRMGRRRVVDFEKRYLCKDGSVIWGHATVAGVFGPDGDLSYFAANVQDITERKLAEEELEAFVYTVSHDLRSPLTSIIGYADFLRESCQDRLDEQALNCLAKISASGEMMAMLMDDLLTLATVGKVQSPVEALDTRKVVNEVVCSLSEQISRVGGSVEIGDLPVVQVSKTLLVQVFDNLIGNAIRHGCKPGDVIEVGGERRGEKVRLYVRDHGPGIPDEERGRIFEVYFRGTTGKSQKGTGVGLATVQKIAKMYEGRTWVEETSGGGSTFWVEMVDVPVSGPVK